MHLLVKILLILLAYLLGSIPSAVWACKWFYGIDIREHGSGNAGATNVIRVVGVRIGVPVLLVDILKGYFAVRIPYLLPFFVTGSSDFLNFQLILAASTVLGHIFPVYVGFKGGKGVATLFGIVLAIAPYPTLICAGIFLITLITTHYVSLSSIVSGFAFPLINLFVFHETHINMIIFTLIVSVLLLITHQKNIERLFNQEESKVHLFKNKKSS